MKKGMKGIGTLLLVGALAASMLPGLSGVKAALAVDPDEDCSLEVSIGTVTDTYAGLMELKTEAVTVDLYRVASISASGAYTAIGDFSGMTFGNIEYDKPDGEQAASAWLDLAAEASELVTENTTKAAQITIGKGESSAKATGLETGLYLVMPEQLETSYYTYDFTPYLVSLPNNNYYPDEENDAWVYDVTMGLKPEQTARLGDLTLTKNLTSWSGTAGSSAMFIFEISYIAPDETTDTWQEAMTFTGTGEQSLTITNIPAGSNVTVEEIYSGAAYTVVGDSMVETSIEADETAEVTITNEHNNTQNGGTGIINHYETENGVYVDTPTNPDSTDGRTVVEEEADEEETVEPEPQPRT